MLDLLNAALNHARQSPMYQQKLSGFGALSSIDDFAAIPFTTKQDLRDNYPFGTLAVDMDQVVEVHTSSGTTGKPTLSLFTARDLELGSNYISKAWSNFGVTSSSRLQFMMGYGMFSGAALNTYAIQKTGAFVLPAGVQPTVKHVELLQDFKIDTLVATPSYYLRLHNHLSQSNIKLSDLGIKTGIAAGETYSDDLKQKLSALLGIRIFDHYGLCEVNTGIIYECNTCGRMAVLKDYIYAEVIDPETGALLPEGEYGELVLTATMKEASPIIRYRTGDSVALIQKHSDCGNCYGSTIVSRVRGRIDDVIYYKGLLLSPHEIRDFLVTESPDGVIDRVRIEANKDEDGIIVNLTVKISFAKPELHTELVQQLEYKLSAQTKAHIGIEQVSDPYFGDASQTKVKLVEYV